MESQLQRTNEEKKEVASKLDGSVKLIFDQMRAAEGEMSVRLAMAEEGAAATVQRIEESKAQVGRRAWAREPCSEYGGARVRGLRSLQPATVGSTCL